MVTKDKNNLIRNSSIELLKVVAIFLIIISHIIPYNYKNFGLEYIDIRLATKNINVLAFQLIRYLGQIGNVIFIIASSWFLVEKNKINIKKIFLIILNCFSISMICLLMIKLLGYELDSKVILKQFFPVMFSNNWFIGCYIMLYLLSPFINIILNNLPEKKMKTIVYFLICFNMLQFFKQNNYIYNYLFGFISIYFVISYLKKYKIDKLNNIKKNIITLLFSISLLFVFVIVLNIFGLKINFLYNKMQYFTNIKNPFVFFISLSVFNLFRKIKLNNKFINYISSLTLLIYLIHDNYLIRELIRKDFFNFIYSTFEYKNILLICLISSIATFIISICISVLYKMTIEKIYYNVINIFNKKIVSNSYKKVNYEEK